MENSDLAIVMPIIIIIVPKNYERDNAAALFGGLETGELHSWSSRNVIVSIEKQKKASSYLWDEDDQLVIRDLIINGDESLANLP